MPNLDWRAALRKHVRPNLPAAAGRLSDERLGLALGAVALVAYWLLKSVLTTKLLLAVGAVGFAGTRPRAQPIVGRVAAGLSRALPGGRRVTPRAAVALACALLVLGAAAWGRLGGGLTVDRGRYARQRARAGAGGGGNGGDAAGPGGGEAGGAGGAGGAAGGYFDPNPGGSLDIVDAYEMGYADALAERASKPPPLRRQYQDEGDRYGGGGGAAAPSSSSSGSGLGFFSIMRYGMVANMIYKLGKPPGGGGWSPSFAIANARNMPVYNWILIGSMLMGIF